MTSSAIPAVELQGLCKAFRGVQANAGIDLRVRAGSIHAVIGENGAGKSTAMKMLYGQYRPDSGEIRIDGVARRWTSPREAIAAGIGMVHQHFMLAGPHDAIENILLGVEGTALTRAGRGWWPGALRRIDHRGARARLTELSRKYGLAIDFGTPVEKLPVGVQQRIEILKVLYRDARIIILDEPTAVLTPQETQELFANLRRLSAEGKTILIITHKLKEVMSLADRVTVFRAGRVVGETEIADTSPELLASLMVGRKVSLTAKAPPAPRLGAPVLELEGVRLLGSASGPAELTGRPGPAEGPAEGVESEATQVGAEKPRDRLGALKFQVRGGEIVGIAGVEGNGQTELLQIVLHPREFKLRGRIRVLGKTVCDGPGTGWETRAIRELGVGVIPEDRLQEGLLLERPLGESFVLGLHRRPEFSWRGILRSAQITARATAAVEAYDVRPRALSTPAGRLSGGNQQKLIVAREFEDPPRFLIASQPTRGVDVGAIEFIHQRILKARAGGAGVLLISSELDEILALSDRILVMYEGRVTAEFERGKADERSLGLCMGGAGA